jgi:hypothetical protein
MRLQATEAAQVMHYGQTSLHSALAIPRDPAQQKAFSKRSVVRQSEAPANPKSLAQTKSNKFRQGLRK